MTDLPKRPCNGCQTFDTDPRHEIIDFTGADAHGGPMHMDCCRDLRNCDICAMVLSAAYQRAGEGVTGAGLRAALVELPALHVQHAETDTSPFDVIDAVRA